MVFSDVATLLLWCVEDSGDGGKVDDAGTLPGDAAQSEPTFTCGVRRQTSPDGSVPLNLTLKHSSAASPLNLPSSLSSSRSVDHHLHHHHHHHQQQHQLRQHDITAYCPSTSQRPITEEPSSMAIHVDEVRSHIINEQVYLLSDQMFRKQRTVRQYTTLIYLINLLEKLVLGLWLDSELHYFSIFTENKKNEHLIFCECHRR